MKRTTKARTVFAVICAAFVLLATTGCTPTGGNTQIGTEQNGGNNNGGNEQNDDKTNIEKYDQPTDTTIGNGNYRFHNFVGDKPHIEYNTM